MKHHIVPLLAVIGACAPPSDHDTSVRLDGNRWLEERLFGDANAETSGVKVVDLDRDGRPEIAVANGMHASEPNQLYSTDLESLHRNPLGHLSQPTFTVAFGYFDRDKRLDYVVANDRGVASRICFARGGCIEQDDVSWDTRHVEVYDLDGDGHDDLIFANKHQPNQLIRGHGNGRFGGFDGAPRSKGDREFGLADAPSVDLVMGDMDLDGSPDVVVANRDGALSRVHLYHRGRFEESYTFGDGSTHAVELVDVDGDGRLDVAAASLGGRNLVYLNEGDGPPVHAVTICKRSRETWDIAIGDINGDGLPDVVEANRLAQDEIHLGGKNGFSPPIRFGPPKGDSRSVTLADLDSDGDLDIIVGRRFAMNAVYINHAASDAYTR